MGKIDEHKVVNRIEIHFEGLPSHTSALLTAMGARDGKPLEFEGEAYEFDDYVIFPTLDYASGGAPRDWGNITYKRAGAEVSKI